MTQQQTICVVFAVGMFLNAHWHLITACLYFFLLIMMLVPTMTVSYRHLLIVLLSLIPFSLVLKKSLTASIVQIFFAWRIRLLTNNWYYAIFIITAAVSGGGDI